MPETRPLTTADAVYEDMRAHLGKIVPDFELRMKADLAAEINRVKLERNADN